MSNYSKEGTPFTDLEMDWLISYMDKQIAMKYSVDSVVDAAARKLQRKPETITKIYMTRDVQKPDSLTIDDMIDGLNKMKKSYYSPSQVSTLQKENRQLRDENLLLKKQLENYDELMEALQLIDRGEESINKSAGRSFAMERNGNLVSISERSH